MEEVIQEEVLQIGGYYWFRGMVGETVVKQVLYVPPPAHNLEIPVIPIWDEWIPASRFSGRWWGPIEPPKEFSQWD